MGVSKLFINIVCGQLKIFVILKCIQGLLENLSDVSFPTNRLGIAFDKEDSINMIKYPSNETFSIDSVSSVKRVIEHNKNRLGSDLTETSSSNSFLHDSLNELQGKTVKIVYDVGKY